MSQSNEYVVLIVPVRQPTVPPPATCYVPPQSRPHAYDARDEPPYVDHRPRNLALRRRRRATVLLLLAALCLFLAAAAPRSIWREQGDPLYVRYCLSLWQIRDGQGYEVLVIPSSCSSGSIVNIVFAFGRCDDLVLARTGLLAAACLTCLAAFGLCWLGCSSDSELATDWNDEHRLASSCPTAIGGLLATLAIPCATFAVVVFDRFAEASSIRAASQPQPFDYFNGSSGDGRNCAIAGVVLSAAVVILCVVNCLAARR